MCVAGESGGVSLAGLDVQVPATEQTGIQRPATGQTDCTSPVGGGIHLVHIYINSQ